MGGCEGEKGEKGTMCTCMCLCVHVFVSVCPSLCV